MCDICNMELSEGRYNSHIKSKGHIIKELLKNFKIDLNNL